jgi:hypothetical protein
MNRKQFYAAAGSLFEQVLGPAGFTREGSRRCTFWRKTTADIYHFVAADPHVQMAQYDVKVFATGPAIDPLFHRRFPDDLEIPTDRWCYLSESGVGPEQQLFNRRNDENLRNRFEKTVRTLLADVAIPYLDGIETIEDLLPLIHNDGFRAMALYASGHVAEAHPLLRRVRSRFAELNAGNVENQIWLRAIDDRLNG